MHSLRCSVLQTVYITGAVVWKLSKRIWVYTRSYGLQASTDELR